MHAFTNCKRSFENRTLNGSQAPALNSGTIVCCGFIKVFAQFFFFFFFVCLPGAGGKGGGVEGT